MRTGLALARARTRVAWDTLRPLERSAQLLELGAVDGARRFRIGELLSERPLELLDIVQALAAWRICKGIGQEWRQRSIYCAQLGIQWRAIVPHPFGPATTLLRLRRDGLHEGNFGDHLVQRVHKGITSRRIADHDCLVNVEVDAHAFGDVAHLDVYQFGSKHARKHDRRERRKAPDVHAIDTPDCAEY